MYSVANISFCETLPFFFFCNDVLCTLLVLTCYSSMKYKFMQVKKNPVWQNKRLVPMPRLLDITESSLLVLWVRSP